MRPSAVTCFRRDGQALLCEKEDAKRAVKGGIRIPRALDAPWCDTKTARYRRKVWLYVVFRLVPVRYQGQLFSWSNFSKAKKKEVVPPFGRSDTTNGQAGGRAFAA